MTSTDSSIWSPSVVAIIGTGLLGGSFALSLRRAFPGIRVRGVGRRTETLELARERGIIDDVCETVEEASDGSDLICVATPVDLVPEQVRIAARVCAEDAVITDVGSTKATIVSAVEADENSARYYVGGHPIAGGEKSGPEHARGDLFLGRAVVLTPTERTDAARVLRLEAIWKACGAAPVLRTTPEEHDRLLAATSHLPHLVASALASILPEGADPFVGTGWRSTTRIAGGAAEMWTAICRENASAIVEQMLRMETQLRGLREAIAGGDDASLRDLLEQARAHCARLEEQ